MVKEKLTNTQLRFLMKSMGHKLTALPRGKKLPVKRGLLYHYRTIVRDDVHPGEGDVEIDCGFNTVIDKPFYLDKKLFRGKIMLSTKENGKYDLLQLKLQPSRDVLYTYKAKVRRVIDADTLFVRVDVGFGINRYERLRFKGIDAPEMNTLSGRAAKKHLQTLFADVDCIVIKTYGTDQYQRYVVDVFFIPKESNPHIIAAKGRFLNQELVDQGIAEVWRKQ